MTNLGTPINTQINDSFFGDIHEMSSVRLIQNSYHCFSYNINLMVTVSQMKNKTFF